MSRHSARRTELMRRCVSVSILALATADAGAYVGEISKDSPADQIEGLPSQAERHRAYRILFDWVSTAKPEAPMPSDVMRAYRLMRNSDEQVMIVTHQQFLDRALVEIRPTLNDIQRQRIVGYRVRVTAAFDGAARVDRTERAVLIPVDLLHDVWTTAMAFEEMESIVPPPFGETIFYVAARVNPALRRELSSGKTLLAQGLTMVLTGRWWSPTRERWNDALWNAYAATRGAALHQTLHELCHVMSDHKDYAELTPAQAMAQERQADSCAYALMPDRDKLFFNPAGAIMVLNFRSFDQSGVPLTSQTHPPVLCRGRSLASALVGNKRFEEVMRSQLKFLLKTLDEQIWMMGGQDKVNWQRELRKVWAICGS